MYSIRGQGCVANLRLSKWTVAILNGQLVQENILKI